MDIQARKLNLIQNLIQIQDEKVLNAIEEIITAKRYNTPKQSQFTSEQVISRALESEEQYKKGNTITLEELETITKNW